MDSRELGERFAVQMVVRVLLLEIRHSVPTGKKVVSEVEKLVADVMNSVDTDGEAQPDFVTGMRDSLKRMGVMK